MPLSVPLKTSRTGGRGIPHGSASAAQAAAQLAAQSGAQAATPSEKSSMDYCQRCGRAKTAVRTGGIECGCTEEQKKVGDRLPAPEGPIPPVTGAVWGHNVSASAIAARQAASYRPPGLANNTPQAVLRFFEDHEREREAQHCSANGKQIASQRPTCPSASFHNGPSGRVVEEKARCREIGEHPMLRNPGPEAYDVDPIQPVCMVPNGWLKEPRFKNSPFEGERQVDNPTKLIKWNTDCPPLSPTYPYPAIFSEGDRVMIIKSGAHKGEYGTVVDPDCDFGNSSHAVRVKREKDDVEVFYQNNGIEIRKKEPPQTGPAPDGTSEELPPSPPPVQEPSHAHQTSVTEIHASRNPIRTADLNAQHFKYPKKPVWGFGSSGLGFRFAAGTAFSKQPLKKPATRLRGFRELRESIPERSEKDYQEALDKAKAEAAKAAADAEPTPVPSPAQTRKSAGALQSREITSALQDKTLEPQKSATNIGSNVAEASDTKGDSRRSSPRGDLQPE